MADECCTQNQNIMLLSCSGGSNVGQLANRASVELTQEGYGKINNYVVLTELGIGKNKDFNLKQDVNRIKA